MRIVSARGKVFVKGEPVRGRGRALPSAIAAAIVGFTMIPGCGDASVDGTNSTGYPPPPGPLGGTGGASGSGGTGGTAGTGGTGGSGGSGAQPPRDAGSDSDVRDASSEADRGSDAPVTDVGTDSPDVKVDGDAGLPDRNDGASSDATDGDAGTTFNWRDGIIYYIFVDRFFDSNAQNNCVVPGVSPMNVYGKLLPTLLCCGGK